MEREGKRRVLEGQGEGKPREEEGEGPAGGPVALRLELGLPPPSTPTARLLQRQSICRRSPTNPITLLSLRRRSWEGEGPGCSITPP